MLGVAKQILTKWIEELASKTQFAIVFGSLEPGGVKKFPESGKPVEATEENKKNAAAFLVTAPVDGAPSVSVDLTAALRSAEKLTSIRKSIIYVGRGIIVDDTAENVLRKVATENRLAVKISVIGIEPPKDAEEFLKKLAAANGGTYARVQ